MYIWKVRQGQVKAIELILKSDERIMAFDSPSIFEICFSTFLAQPLQCMDTLSTTIYMIHQEKIS